jgi:hypothetical protein
MLPLPLLSSATTPSSPSLCFCLHCCCSLSESLLLAVTSIATELPWQHCDKHLLPPVSLRPHFRLPASSLHCPSSSQTLLLFRVTREGRHRNGADLLCTKPLPPYMKTMGAQEGRQEAAVKEDRHSEFPLPTLSVPPSPSIQLHTSLPPLSESQQIHFVWHRGD